MARPGTATGGAVAVLLQHQLDEAVCLRRQLLGAEQAQHSPYSIGWNTAAPDRLFTPAQGHASRHWK